ncbi:MAG: hypothetical protein IPM54_35495 [Polyangiaceae bacterium]|nr:hypothetical protein [Polyangiaceae bacterium]
MRAFRALFTLLASCVVMAASSSEAGAYERQWQVGLGVGYAQLINEGGTPVTPASLHGIGSSLTITYGLTDAINIIGHADFNAHPGDAPTLLYGGSVGVAYVIDVLRWVPWAGVTAGGYGVSALEPCVATNDVPCTNARLGFSLLGGIDYQVSRSFSIGAMGRYGVLLFGNQNAVDHTIGGFIRAQYIWGY